MKKYFILAATALAFAACTQDELTTVPDGEVALRVNAAISGIATRAGGTEWTDGDRIGISTLPGTATVYINKPYRRSGSGFVPVSDGIFFQDGDEVTFKAYYPFTGVEGTAAGIIKGSTTKENQTADKQPEIDYLYASGATADKLNPTVSFTDDHAFTHRMSQITLTFIEGSDMDLDKSFTYTLGRLKMQGTFDTQNGTAKADADAQAADLTIKLDNVQTEQVKDEYCYTAPSLILFPQDAAAIDLTVTVDGQTYTATLSPKDGALQWGNNYTWDVTVKKTGLTVKAEIKDWDEVDGGEVTAEM